MSAKTLLFSLSALALVGGLGYGLIQNSQAENNADDTVVIADSVLPERRSEIEAIIREYLADNPEVIIDSLRDYEQKQIAIQEEEERRSLVTYLPDLVSGKYGYATDTGSQKPKVAVIEFFDYHCGYCKKATGLVQDIIKDEQDVTVVFRELPILREESVYAAEIALAAREQGKYEELHLALMKASGIIDEGRVETIAEKVGLDLDALYKEYQTGNHEEAILNTREIADALGLGGTPAFIVTSTDGSYSEIIGGFNPPAIKAAIKKARNAG